MDGVHFYKACFGNNVEIIEILIEYANKLNIIFELNEKNEWNQYPILLIYDNNNIDMAKLLMEYTNNHNIILELNEKDSYGFSLILCACFNNNAEILQLLI